MDKSTFGGVGLCTVIFIVFLILKPVGVIAWSWWFVTMPLWLPSVILLIVFFITIGIIAFSDWKQRKSK